MVKYELWATLSNGFNLTYEPVPCPIIGLFEEFSNPQIN